jgi:hypothetical protein
MKKYIIGGILMGCLLVLFFLIYEKPIRTDTPSTFMKKLNNYKLIDSLDNRVLNYGDTLAYGELRMIHYLAEQRSTGFLFYALVMSNKYNYGQASYDVYYILTHGDSTLDVKSKEMADYYLEKSKLSGSNRKGIK